jgi:hypothetical protein
MQSSHIVWFVDDKEENKGEQVHPNQDWNGIEYAADHIGSHSFGIIRGETQKNKQARGLLPIQSTR